MFAYQYLTNFIHFYRIFLKFHNNSVLTEIFIKIVQSINYKLKKMEDRILKLLILAGDEGA